MISMEHAAIEPPMSPADRRAHELASYVRRPAVPLAADDHSKVNDPLPPRPRGPHPYRSAGVA
ncbi:hypothetical protein [Streptomyces sp. NPDC091217]|uniref:hypothetical protein n=1 Tax=Streptomyces sp. NPDC091217 TaxID=3365975 RepID=UPI00382CF480